MFESIAYELGYDDGYYGYYYNPYMKFSLSFFDYLEGFFDGEDDYNTTNYNWSIKYYDF